MLAVLTFLAVIAADPTPSAAPATGKHVVVNPSWDRQPTSDELIAAYPTDALVKGVEGKVVIECRVLPDETLTDCKVIKEDPPGQGFGAAGLSLSSVMRMHPKIVDGTPSDKGKVVIPLGFKTQKPGDVGAYAPNVAHCVGLAQAAFEKDPSALPDYGVWLNVYVTGEGRKGDKPSQWIAALEEARLAGEKALTTPQGQDELKACFKYSAVAASMMGQGK